MRAPSPFVTIPVAVVVLAIVLVSCGDSPTTDFKGASREGKTDWCGFTWKRTRVPADLIEFQHEPDWNKYPGICRSPGIEACTWRRSFGDKSVATILTTKPAAEMLADTTDCNAVRHEIEHALGLEHVEPHKYVPQDHTRR